MTASDTGTETASDKDVAIPLGDAGRAVPAQPAFPPAGRPPNRAPLASVLTPGQPVAPPPSATPPSFSFGEPPAVATLIEEEPAAAPSPSSPSPPPLPEAPQALASGLAVTTAAPDLRQLELELAAARDELKALHEMLEDLPEIFERKFQQRLATVLEHQKHLLADNQALRERLYSLSPSDRDGPPGSGPGAGPGQPLLLPTVAPRKGWGEALKRSLGLGRPLKISRPGDGRPIGA